MDGHFPILIHMRKKDVIIGRHPVLEALNNDIKIEKIFINKSANGEEVNNIMRIAKEKNILFQFVPIEKINYLLFPIFANQKVNHQGIVAVSSVVENNSIEDIYNQILDWGETPLFLILDGITDVRNFGAIARSAKCFGVHAIITSQRNSAFINAEAMKTSAGALHTLPVCKTPKIEDALNFLILCGIQIIETKIDATKQYYQHDYTIPMALVMGSEERGVSPFISNLVDDSIRIPMSEEFDSLNVSVATGIILSEAWKQRHP